MFRTFLSESNFRTIIIWVQSIPEEIHQQQVFDADEKNEIKRKLLESFFCTRDVKIFANESLKKVDGYFVVSLA